MEDFGKPPALRNPKKATAEESAAFFAAPTITVSLIGAPPQKKNNDHNLERATQHKSQLRLVLILLEPPQLLVQDELKQERHLTAGEFVPNGVPVSPFTL